jgi:hypothetical protein
MDQSSFGSALDGSDLGGNEVQAVRMVSVSHRSEAGGIVTAKTARVSREAIAWGPDESVVLSRPAEPGASSSSASARFDSSFADFWFVASCVSPFAEAGARYRAASSAHKPTRKGRSQGNGLVSRELSSPLERAALPEGAPKGVSTRKSGGSAAREPARECWAGRWCEQSRRLNVVPTRAALRVVPKQGVVRLFIPTSGMTSVRVSLPRDVRAGDRCVSSGVVRPYPGRARRCSPREVVPKTRRSWQGVHGRQLRAG